MVYVWTVFVRTRLRVVSNMEFQEVVISNLVVNYQLPYVIYNFKWLKKKHCSAAALYPILFWAQSSGPAPLHSDTCWETWPSSVQKSSGWEMNCDADLAHAGTDRIQQLVQYFPPVEAPPPTATSPILHQHKSNWQVECAQKWSLEKSPKGSGRELAVMHKKMWCLCAHLKKGPYVLSHAMHVFLLKLFSGDTVAIHIRFT